MQAITERIRERLEKNRLRLVVEEKRKDYKECLRTEGRILELELLLYEALSLSFKEIKNKEVLK